MPHVERGHSKAFHPNFVKPAFLHYRHFFTDKPRQRNTKAVSTAKFYFSNAELRNLG
jgi:hypothetical protein